jgi:hypothetical protein
MPRVKGSQKGKSLREEACAAARARLHAFHDATPENPVRDEVALHLAECPECAARFAFEAALRNHVRTALCNSCCPSHLRHAIVMNLKCC